MQYEGLYRSVSLMAELRKKYSQYQKLLIYKQNS